MSHVVLSQGAAGAPQIDEVGSLADALRHVERLRNEEGVTDVRVLREVPIEMKAYYRVVALDDAGGTGGPGGDGGDGGDAALAATDPGTVPPADAPAAAPADGPRQPPPGSAVLAGPPVVAPVTAENAEATSSSDRRASLFGRG